MSQGVKNARQSVGEQIASEDEQRAGDMPEDDGRPFVQNATEDEASCFPGVGDKPGPQRPRVA